MIPFLVTLSIFLTLGWLAQWLAANRQLQAERQRHDAITAEFSQMLYHSRRTCAVSDLSADECEAITEWIEQEIQHIRESRSDWKAQVDLKQLESIRVKLSDHQPMQYTHLSKMP